MLLLIGIASAWCICCAMAVALCVMASRGDRAMERAMTRIAAHEPAVDVAFVATLAEPAPATPARSAAAQRANA
jgi:hypothetical protein